MQINDQTEIAEPMCLYRSKSGTVVIARECLISLVSREREFAVLSKDSDSGILPFLLAEDGSTFEDVFGLEDEEGISHVDPRLPLPLHFGLTGDDDYLEMSPCGPNGGLLLRRFHWCIFTPFEDDPSGKQYELRFATIRKEDAEFVAETLGCCDSLIVPVVDADIEVV